jgi:hypothetical protein
MEPANSSNDSYQEDTAFNNAMNLIMGNKRLETFVKNFDGFLWSQDPLKLQLQADLSSDGHSETSFVSLLKRCQLSLP